MYERCLKSQCLVVVRRMSEGSLKGVWKVFGGSLEGILMVSGSCLESWCLKGVKSLSEQCP